MMPTNLDRVDALLSRLAAPPPLTPTQIARIRDRIEAPSPPRRFRFAIIIAVTLAFASSALAMYTLHEPSVPVVQPPPPAPKCDLDSQPVAPVRLAKHVTPDRALEVAPPPHAPALAPVPASVRSTTTEPEASTTATSTPEVTTTAETALGTESRLLSTALRQLRRQRSPRDAIATLDAYATQFPSGMLREEARAARIEALLALGEKQEALVLLDAGVVKSDLAVARGELRLEAGRIAAAAHDFDSALIGANDDVEQRALYGRAACRIRLGEPEAAKRDLEDYLRRFPNGKSASEAKRVLAQIR